MRFLSVLTSWKVRHQGRRGRQPRRPRRHQPRLEIMEGRSLPGDTLFGALLAFDFGAPLGEAEGLWGPISNQPSPPRNWSAPVADASPVGFDVHHGDSGLYAPVSTVQEPTDQTGRKPPAIVGADNWFALVLLAQGSVGEQPPEQDGIPSVLRGDTFTAIDVPGAIETNTHGINSRGDIVGGYALPGEACNLGLAQACPHAFLLSRGQFSTFDIPGAAWTFATRNNARGDIVGWYGTPDGVTHGFLLSRGQFTSIDYPGATLTLATGFNRQGDITGRYDTPDGRAHGYVQSRGEFTTIDVPGVTNASGINARGDMVGGRNTGYLLTGWPGSPELTQIVFPGAVLTNANSLNNRGDIVGRYDLPDGSTHGYVLREGEFTTIDFPGAANWTSAIAINERGDIVGKYQTGDGRFHGYLLSR